MIWENEASGLVYLEEIARAGFMIAVKYEGFDGIIRDEKNSVKETVVKLTDVNVAKTYIESVFKIKYERPKIQL